MTSPIFISAGGTGGGIYPAVTVAHALRDLAADVPLHFVGSAGGMESKLVPRELFAGYHEVLSGPLNGVGIPRAAISAIKLTVGILQSIALIVRLRPSGLFLTGGWATFPIAIACWLLRVPVAIYVPDIEPALAIKFLSRLSTVILTTTSESAAYFPNRQTVETGYPLRPGVLTATRADAIQKFGLDPAKKTLLVTGGSRGARSINAALSSIARDLLADGVQIIHVSGELDWPTVQSRRDEIPDPARQGYHAFAYLEDDMGLALAAADLVVSRSGASSIGEYPYFGLPAILVPYPHAWRYQKVNADWLVSRGAAVRLNDDRLSAELLSTIRGLLGDPARLARMHEASRALGRSDAATTIAQHVIAMKSR